MRECSGLSVVRLVCILVFSLKQATTRFDDIMCTTITKKQTSTTLNLLEVQEKTAYEEAWERAPRLVVAESNPAWFLRFAESDPIAAAQRLTSYWEHRKETFGDRAFLPMDLSGQGAMTADDIKTLQTGYLMNLPCDRQGRPVLYYDRSKRPQDEKVSPRILFFAFQTAMENEISRHHDFVVLVNMSNPHTALDLEVAQHSMPIKVGSIYLICNQPGARRLHPTLKTTIQRAYDSLTPFYKAATTVHLACSGQDCLEKLSPHFTSDSLPVSFGGTWSWDQSSWANGAQAEPDLSCLIRNSLWSYTQSVAESTPNLAPQDCSSVSASRKLSAEGQGKTQKRPLIDAGKPTEDDKAKKRRLNVLYARRRRKKERIEIEVLQDQCLKFHAKNNSSQDENARLEKLLQNAIQEVARHEATLSSPPLPNSSWSVSSNGALIDAELLQLIRNQVAPVSQQPFALPCSAMWVTPTCSPPPPRHLSGEH